MISTKKLDLADPGQIDINEESVAEFYVKFKDIVRGAESFLKEKIWNKDQERDIAEFEWKFEEDLKKMTMTDDVIFRAHWIEYGKMLVKSLNIYAPSRLAYRMADEDHVKHGIYWIREIRY